MAKKETDYTPEDEILDAELEANKSKIKPHNRLVLNWAQSEFYTAFRNHKFALASGGFRSGKSTVLAAIICQYLSYPNSRVLLTTRNFSDLKRSTLMVLLYGSTLPDGTFAPPLLPPQAIKTRDYVNGFIILHNGSILLLSGCADETKARSMTVSLVVVEECTRITETAFKELCARASLTHPLGCRFIAACNPEHRGHYLYRKFVLDRNPNFKMVCLPTSANSTNLPPDYEQGLSGYSEADKKRYLLGEWLETGNGVFTQFDRAKNVAPCKHLMTPEHMAEIVIGQDLGGGSGFAGFTVCGKGYDNKIYAFLEHSKKAITHREMLQWMEQYRGITTSTVVYDSANQVAGNEMLNAQWKCIPSVKNLEASVDVCNSLFSTQDLVIDPSCEILIQEIEEQYRSEETGRWVKTRATPCDVLDACRYAVWHLADISNNGQQKQHFWYVC